MIQSHNQVKQKKEKNNFFFLKDKEVEDPLTESRGEKEPTFVVTVSLALLRILCGT